MDNGLGGSTAQFNQSGITAGSLALYKSNREYGLLLDKTIKPGFGVVKAGTVLAAIDNDQLVPYAPVLIGDNDVGRTFLVADATAATTVYVTIEDSYKFAVGDVLVGVDNAPAYTDLGAITAIDRITEPHRAAITVTNALTAATADQANIHHKTASSSPFTVAAMILDSDVFTGEGDSALGANAPVLLSNAILYTAVMRNLDADARTALGMTQNGRYEIVK